MRLPATPIETEFIPFAGGFDVVTPPLSVPPGYLRAAQNYELDINGGYARMLGYERFDGRVKPSDAAYAVLTCNISGAVSVGDVLTDNATTSYGTVIALPTGQAILTKLTGTFSTGNIKVATVVVGTCTGAQTVDGASTALLHAQYKNLAADSYRSDITTVTGSGNILGVWVYNDVVYAFRNNAGGTAAAMFKATASGWSAVALGRELQYTTGTAAVTEGQTLTGATSGASGVVTRIVIRSGTVGAGTAAGSFIFATITGTFQNAENLQVGGVTKAVASGADSANAFTVPTGRFKFVNKNFGGSTTTARMYGCDGKNKAFEFDGTVFVPIRTGMTTDTPNLIAAHKNQLFLSFGSSVQHSSPGSPYAFSAVTGASELAMGDTVTGFMPQPGSETRGAMAIFCRNQISILYGSGVADWNLTTYKDEIGALAHSVQHVGNTLMFDDRGITSLETTQAFGNFADATLSQRIQTWLTTKRTLVNDSCIVRDKTQYRLFFSDRYAIFATFSNKKLLGFMPVLMAHVVKCICSAELTDGSEAIYFGSDNGYVYQMEKGTSFDGDAIEAYIYLAYAHLKSPQTIKRFRGVSFEVSGNGYSEFVFSYELGYTTSEIEQPTPVTNVTSFVSGNWDSGSWDVGVWDGQTLSPFRCDMKGRAENVSLMIRSNSDYFAATKFSGALIRFSKCRDKR